MRLLGRSRLLREIHLRVNEISRLEVKLLGRSSRGQSLAVERHLHCCTGHTLLRAEGRIQHFKGFVLLGQTGISQISFSKTIIASRTMCIETSSMASLLPLERIRSVIRSPFSASGVFGACAGVADE